jgi:Ser/Thr protein kinase RdoA (MazF antagonist)
MASMHSFTTGKQIPDLQRRYTPESIVEGTMQAIQSVLPAHPEVHQKLESMFALLRKLLRPEMLQELKTGICHGDPHYENIFIESAINKLTMYDFDFSGNGYLLYDIGSFCFYERHNEKNIEAFLRGYSQVLPLSQRELALIAHFKILMRLFHLGARSRNADGIKNPLWFPEEIVEKINEIEKEALLLK